AAWEEKQLKEAKIAALAAASKGSPAGGQKTVARPVGPPAVGRKAEEPPEPKIVLPPPADFVFTSEEHAVVVKKLFDRHFPPGTKFGTPLPPPPFVQPPPPRPS